MSLHDDAEQVALWEITAGRHELLHRGGWHRVERVQADRLHDGFLYVTLAGGLILHLGPESERWVRVVGEPSVAEDPEVVFERVTARMDAAEANQ